MTKQTRRRTSASIAVTLSILLFTAVPAFAQTVAEAARRERERKKTTHPLHVYTNEDLAKTNILVPEDEARATRSRGSDSAEVASVAPGAATDTAPGAAANTAILQASPAVAVSAKNRKEAAASVIAATPNVQTIDSYSGPMALGPEVAAARPAFPAVTNGAAPLFTSKGQIALPEVSLPQVTPDAYPLFDAPWTINFPGGAEGNIISARAASPEKTSAAPPVSAGGRVSGDN